MAGKKKKKSLVKSKEKQSMNECCNAGSEGGPDPKILVGVVAILIGFALGWFLSGTNGVTTVGVVDEPFTVDQEKIDNIRTIFEKSALASGNEVTITVGTVEKQSVIVVPLSVPGQTEAILYVSEDYQYVLGFETNQSVVEMEAQIDNVLEGTVAQPTDTTPTAEPTYEVDVSGEVVLGDPEAPVQIVEFSDLECPFCKKFHIETFGQIKENYIDTGKVSFVYLHYPLSFHPEAPKAAEAMECATEQDNRWEYLDALFAGSSLSIDSLKGFAVDLELNSTQFDECLDNGKYADKVQADIAKTEGAIGPTGTPSFLIDGKKISGAYPYSTFEAAIEEALGN